MYLPRFLTYSFFILSLFSPLVCLTKEESSSAPSPKVESTDKDSSASTEYSSPFHIIPEPKSIVLSGASPTISANESTSKNDFEKVASFDKPLPVLEKHNNTALAPESYTLNLSPEGAVIEYGDPAGLMYAKTTLNQINAQVSSDRPLPYAVISDTPRFPWRALMIDTARYYWTPDDIKRFMNIMALYKFNKLHIHLTDDQGWRLPVPGYPKLKSIASKRKETEGNGIPHEGFYTKEELIDLVNYGKVLHIEIIPEIDVPGHNQALGAAYPEFICYPEHKPEVRTTPGVSEELICPGKPEVWRFYEAVFAELADIFPSSYVHLGGDEAPETHWKTCPTCRAFREKHDLADMRAQKQFFSKSFTELLARLNKKPLFWYEDEASPYPEGTTVYTWRWGKTPETIKRAQKEKLSLICSAGEHAYLDYPQVQGGLPKGMPLTTLEQSYKLDPGYGLPDDEQKHIIGVEGTLWGEWIPSLDQALKMAYPRALALAEAGWSPLSARSWKHFSKKVAPQMLLIDKMKTLEDPAFFIDTLDSTSSEKKVAPKAPPAQSHSPPSTASLRASSSSLTHPPTPTTTSTIAPLNAIHNPKLPAEHYTLTFTPKGTVITYADRGALIYAQNTLKRLHRQFLLLQYTSSGLGPSFHLPLVPCVTIQDKAGYPHRFLKLASSPSSPLPLYCSPATLRTWQALTAIYEDTPCPFVFAPFSSSAPLAPLRFHYPLPASSLTPFTLTLPAKYTHRKFKQLDIATLLGHTPAPYLTSTPPGKISTTPTQSSHSQTHASILPGAAPLAQLMQEAGVSIGDPVFLRIVKENRLLELWMSPPDTPKYKRIKTYPILAQSGRLGPKEREGDRQAPEGFYRTFQKHLNPRSSYHLAFNIGYPNAYDRALKRTGSYIMVHGKAISVGCFAMGDRSIEEIYKLVAAFVKSPQGQNGVPVHVYPFVPTKDRLSRERRNKSQHLDFWSFLYDTWTQTERQKEPPFVYMLNGELKRHPDPLSEGYPQLPGEAIPL